MKKTLSNLASVLMIVWLILPVTARAALPGLTAAAPSESAPLSETEVKLRESLEAQITEANAETERILQQTQQLADSVQQAPTVIDVMRKDIDVVGQLVGKDRIDRLNLQQVSDRLSSLDGQQRAIDTALNDVFEQIAQQQNIPTAAREKIANLQAEIDALEKRMQSVQGSNDAIKELKVKAIESQREKLVAMRKLHESQLDGYQKMLELYTANRDLLSAQLAAMKEVYQSLNQRFELLSRNEEERQKAAFAEIEAALSGMPQAVIDIAIKNKKLNDQMVMLQGDVREMLARDKLHNDVSQEIKQRFQVAQQQLEIGGYNRFYMEHVRYVNRILRPLLNEDGDIGNLQATLVEARSKQFTYDDQLRELRSNVSLEEKMQRQLQTMTEEERNRPDVRAEMRRLYNQRETLLQNLSEINGNYVVALTNLELSRKQLTAEERKFMAMLNQKLVWLHSSPPMNWKVFLTATEGAYEFFRDTPWMELPQYFNEYRQKHPLHMVVGALVLAGLVYIRRRMLEVLEKLGKDVGRVGQDKFRHTLEAAVVSLVAALPVPLAMAMLASILMLQSPYQSFAYNVGDILLRLGPIALMIALLPVMTRQNGLARLHFNWREHVLAVIDRQVPWFIAQIPFYALGWFIVDNAGDQGSVFTFGRVLLVVANLILAWNCFSLLRPGSGIIEARQQYAFFDPHWRDRFLWMPFLIGLPLFCAALGIIGYDYTVVFFAKMVYITLFAGFGIFLVHEVFTRWFSVQERQIALDRALARRAAEQAARAKEGLDADEVAVDVDALDEINLESISERNRGLLRITASAAFIAVLWQLWSDVAPVLDVLDKYVLWSVNGIGDTGQPELVPITLWRLLCALFVLMLTIIAGRNLPGLVEVVLLQRFQMDKSIRFTITTVARYCIVVVGVMVGSELLGIAWEKIGWLVAALGVGLGFGLQEIFANFISGIIILIERPIRIGDLVTINGQSGVVSQIRMRATTVTDSDRKELIIPNKAIMTSQLINWTLSDNVTRVVFPVSVVHGSDVDMVIRTLLEVAQQHPNVMKTPAPGAFFVSIGTSSLNFELRVFVSELSRRSSTTHDINIAIDKRFRAQDIQFSSSHLDVRLTTQAHDELESRAVVSRDERFADG